MAYAEEDRSHASAVGWFHEWLAQNADKTFTFHRPTSGPLSRSRAAQARLPRPSCVRPVCWSSHESHRPALVLRARNGERGPELAKHRPSNDHVGVLAGAPPANGPSGCNPSAPSPWCSPWPSSSPRRRTRCSSHRMPASHNHHAAYPQAALCGWQETIGRCAGSCS